MILQDLLHYYQENSSTLPPFGFEYKEISFVIILNEKGDLLDIEDKRTETGEGKKTLVPQSVKRSGIGASPNYLWDNLKYVFGIGDSKNPKQQESLTLKRISFLQNLKELIPSLKEHKEIQAVISFLESAFLKKLQKYPLWEKILKQNAYISFSLKNSNRLVCQEASIMEAFSLFSKDAEERTGTCILTGSIEPITRLHPIIQGIPGAQESGASLINYNLPSAESFGKEQGYNAPMSQSSAFAYSTALKHLLDSSKKITFNQDITVVFWSQAKSSFDSTFADFLKTSSKDSPSLLSRCQEAPDDSSLFFIHALSPNGARLALRLSWKGPIGELKKRIIKYCKDLEITNPARKQETFPLYSLLQTISPCQDIKYVQPHLAGRILFNLLNNLPYPRNLLSILLEKLSDSEGISHRRVSLIKAWLNQYSDHTPLHPSLDTSNLEIGYLLGRLFSALEITKKELREKKQSPAVHSFYKMSSISPKTIFSHLIKIHAPSNSNYLKDLIASILEAIPIFPESLCLSAQGEFAVGYYHQKQQIFLELKKR